MTKQQQFSRRQFIGAVAVAGGSFILPPSNAFASFNSSVLNGYPSTDHFWYRKPPNMPYVDSKNIILIKSKTRKRIRI